jgi:hypothetical protein
MLEHPDFVPFIRTWEWPGVVDCHTRPLVADDPKLVVAYGVRGLHDNTYLTSAGFHDLHLDQERVHQVAVGHLQDQHVPPWTVEYIGTLAVAMRTGDEMVAADLLAGESMRELTDFFACEVIYIGVPSLFTMVASTHPLALGGIVAALHQDASRPRAGALSSQALILSRGDLVGSVLSQAPGGSGAGFQTADELAHAVSHGLASVSLLIDRAKNITGSSSATTFAPCLRRHLGALPPALGALVDAALEEFGAAHSRLARARHLIDHIEIMAVAAQSSLGAADYARFAGAVLGAATTISQAGTGFWGIGRTLPQHVRLTLQAVGGLLGVAAPGAARRATLP